MYPVTVSSGLPQHYFFAEIVKPLYLEQVTQGILKFDRFMLTTINCMGSLHIYRSPAAATDSQKITFLF